MVVCHSNNILILCLQIEIKVYTDQSNIKSIHALYANEFVSRINQMESLGYKETWDCTLISIKHGHYDLKLTKRTSPSERARNTHSQ